jgi:hypothetical protein
MLGWVLKKSLEGATGAPGDTINAGVSFFNTTLAAGTVLMRPIR